MRAVPQSVPSADAVTIAAMRRLAQWMLNALTVLSRLWFVPLLALWWRAQVAPGQLTVEHRGRFWRLRFQPDRVETLTGPNRQPPRKFPLLAPGDEDEDHPRPHLGLPPPSAPDPLPHGWVWSYEPTGRDPRIHGAIQWCAPGLWRTQITYVTNRFDLLGYYGTEFICSWWLIACLPAVMPAAHLAARASKRLRRRLPLTSELCGMCSYNLTGNISGVCPECGTAIARQA